MLSQVVVRLVQCDLTSTVSDDAAFEIVELEDVRDTAEMLVGIDMSHGPTLLIHGEECLHIGISAVRQGGYEYVYRNELAGIRDAVSPAQSTCNISPGL